MKIFFPVESLNGIDSILDDRFGRAPFIMIYETTNEELVLTKENPFAHQDHGVGVSIANFIIQQKCHAAVGTRFGPKAEGILKTAGIQTVKANATGKETVKDVIQRLAEQG